MDIETLILQFNACITRRDVGALSGFITQDHVFIDSVDHKVIGAEAVLKAWSGFFSAFPDYRNVFTQVIIDGHTAKMLGQSYCSDARLRGAAIWLAECREHKISLWRVYEDTPQVREHLRLTC